MFLDESARSPPMMVRSHCACGEVCLEITGKPLFRMRCHCTICQRFNEAPFGDVVIFRGRDVGLPGGDGIDYQTYKAPPNVQRGRCGACGQPVVERFETKPFPRLRMVPAALLDAEQLPAVSFDAFYSRRLRDIPDDKPKHKGFWASQWAFFRAWQATR